MTTFHYIWIAVPSSGNSISVQPNYAATLQGKPCAKPSDTDIIYLFKAANVTAEYLSAWMSLNHDLPILLRFGGKIQSSFHRFTPAKYNMFIQELQADQQTVWFSDIQQLFYLSRSSLISLLTSKQKRMSVTVQLG